MFDVFYLFGVLLNIMGSAWDHHLVVVQLLHNVYDLKLNETQRLRVDLPFCWSTRTPSDIHGS